MDVHADSCATRHVLEQRRLRLAGRLSTLTTGLTKLIRQDHAAFPRSKAECRRTRIELADARRQI